MKKTAIIIVLCLLGIVVAIFILSKSVRQPEIEYNIDDLLAPDSAADYYEDSNILEVTKGSVKITRSDASVEEVSDTTTVSVGDTIEVLDKSSATLTWFDDSVSRLKKGTVLKIEAADYNPENISETNINIELIKGEVWNKIMNLVDEDSEFLVGHGNVVAGVRGTTNNIFIEEDYLNVESIEHSTVVAEIDRDTGRILSEKVLAKGRLARLPRRTNLVGILSHLELRDIDPLRYNDDWYLENQNNDKKIISVIERKNLQRMRKRAGALPGTKGYERKNVAIEKRLSQITDESERAALKQRIAEMRLFEELYAVKIGMKRGVEGAEKKLSNISPRKLKLLDRSLSDVLPDSESLYSFKNALRSERVSREPDSKKRRKLEERFLERESYDINDYFKYRQLSPERTEKALSNFQTKLRSLDISSDVTLSKIIASQFLEHLENIDLEGKPELKRIMSDHILDRYRDVNLDERPDLRKLRENLIDQLREGDIDPVKLEELKTLFPRSELKEMILSEIDDTSLNSDGFIKPEFLAQFYQLALESGQMELFATEFRRLLNLGQEKLQIIYDSGVLNDLPAEYKRKIEEHLAEITESIESLDVTLERVTDSITEINDEPIVEELRTDEPLTKDVTIDELSEEELLRTKFANMTVTRFPNESVRTKFRQYFANNYYSLDNVRKYLNDAVFRDRVEAEFRAKSTELSITPDRTSTTAP